MSAMRSAATLNAPWTLLARWARDRPICCSVARTRLSDSAASCHAALARNHVRQRTGLVVAPAPAAPPVQGNRHQHVGLIKQFLARPRHPAAHGGREISAVLIFQRMHQRARDIVIAHRGAGALVGRWIGDRLHRQQFGAGIIDKGDPEPRAEGWRDKRQFCPARGADPLAVDRFAAGNAQCRQRNVEHQPRRCRQRVAGRAERTAQVACDAGW